MTISKVVVTAAGLGTRLLPATKEQPKEMLPLFAQGFDGSLAVKPLLHLVFEQLYEFGLRDFCFIVGRGKRAIEDYFTPDYGKGAAEAVPREDILDPFYRRIAGSSIIWVNQPQPKGFGFAVLQAKRYVGSEPFLVHAGDTFIVSRRNDHLKRLVEEFEDGAATAVLILLPVKNPVQFGVAEVVNKASCLMVTRVVEKPAKPRTNLAILPVYAFDSSVMEELSLLGPGVKGEVQLTDAIEQLITKGKTVKAIELGAEDLWLDVGSPRTYWEALRASHQAADWR